MASIKTIKGNITSLKKINKITKAMEAVSVVKMKNAQTRALGNRAYFAALLRLTARYADGFARYIQRETARHTAGADCLLLITADRGLVGSLNAAVLRRAERFLAEHPDAVAVCAGKKGCEFLRRRGTEVLCRTGNIAENVSAEDVAPIAETVTALYRGKKIKTLTVVFQHFVSTFEQRPIALRVLPLDRGKIEETLRDVVFGGDRIADTETAQPSAPYTAEPNEETVLARLFDTLITVAIYGALVENKASEHSARMVAMKNAGDKSDELRREKTLLLNKKRQTLITNEVLEITGSVEALRV